MAVKKSAKKAPTNGDQSHPHAALGGTLEDYFNSKKSYQSEEMKELNKEVTKHLLTGTGANNAMIMEKKNGPLDGEEGTETEEEEASAKHSAAEPEEKKIGEDEEEGGGYEDDYESDSSTAAADKSVAGLTLGDYLQAKGDGVLPIEEHTATSGGGSETKKHAASVAVAADKLPQKPSGHANKKPLPPAVISGMSLDYYLGASSSAAANGDDGDDLAVADGKSPPRHKKKAAMVGGKSKNSKVHGTLTATLPPAARQSSHESTSSGSSHSSAKHYQDHHAMDDDSYATPFQKRQTKKHKLKQQQQHILQTSGAVAKSILLGDSHSHSQLLQTKHLTASGSSSSSSSSSKDKKKPLYGSSNSNTSHSGSANPPLPKLLGSSPSAHGFVPPAGADTTGDDHYDAAAAATADEKLPPLSHQQPHHTGSK